MNYAFHDIAEIKPLDIINACFNAYSCPNLFLNYTSSVCCLFPVKTCLKLIMSSKHNFVVTYILDKPVTISGLHGMRNYVNSL